MGPLNHGYGPTFDSRRCPLTGGSSAAAELRVVSSAVAVANFDLSERLASQGQPFKLRLRLNPYRRNGHSLKK